MKNTKLNFSKLRRVAKEEIEGYTPAFPKPKKKKKSALQKKKDNPNSKYWKTKCDKAWGTYQHKINTSCIVNNDECKGPLNQHHLVSRGNVFLRHLIENNASLCVWHHLYSTTCSPHGGPIGFTKFLEKNYPEKYEWTIANQHKTGKPNYQETFKKLTALIDGI